LRREAIAVYRRLRRAANLRHEDKAAQTRALIEQVFCGKFAEPKVLPPGDLLFAAVPVETMG
jgi:hypothetical protein